MYQETNQETNRDDPNNNTENKEKTKTKKIKVKNPGMKNIKDDDIKLVNYAETLYKCDYSFDFNIDRHKLFDIFEEIGNISLEFTKSFVIGVVN